MGKIRIIKETYYNLRSPAAYAGVQKVYKFAYQVDPTITLKDVENFLLKQTTYTLFKPARKKFPRLKTIPDGLHTDWQCDLCIFDSIAQHNDGYRYLLVCIDVLSRKIFVAPSKSKGSNDIIEAFDIIFKKSGI